MTTANLKLEIEKALKKTNSPAILELIYTILRGDDVPAGKRISRKQYNREIDEVEEEVKKGKVVSHEEVVRRLRKK